MGGEVTHSAVQAGAGLRQHEACIIRYITYCYGLYMSLSITSAQVGQCVFTRFGAIHVTGNPKPQAKKTPRLAESYRLVK